ncbi:MAG TPA: L,D-transpeptidase family protein, partial [Phenylobacterium sp.]|nr:L,D-transpeptidase family protein [Phenylobacterium sp.]
SIATNEILPRAARDPGYLTRNGFRSVDGRLQQRPGAANALGRLKFDLQSPYGVYLHDTPEKNAFSREKRTLSHGCMRLENPEALAQWLLARQGWPANRLASAIADGETRRIALDRPLSLLVVYRTAVVSDGGLHLLPDPYQWDTSLARALAGTVLADTGARDASDCAEQLER